MFPHGCHCLQHAVLQDSGINTLEMECAVGSCYSAASTSMPLPRKAAERCTQASESAVEKTAKPRTLATMDSMARPVKPSEQDKIFNKMLCKSSFLVGAAVANQGGAMEIDTISKNGRNLKSHTSRVNLKTTSQLFLLCVCAIFFSCSSPQTQSSLTYDFSFAELAIKYFETGKSEYLHEISDLDAANHIFNHASNFGGYDGSKLELVTSLLSPIDKQMELLPQFKRNLNFAKENIAQTGVVEEITLRFLPEGFTFSGSLFFTFGYDIGVAFGENSSLNLAHPIFLNNMDEMKYWANLYKNAKNASVQHA